MPRINTVDGANFRGLGDIVLLSWVAEAARETRDPITFYATRTGHYDLLELLGQQVSDDPLHPSSVVSDIYAKEIAEHGARPRVDYVREHLAVTTTYKRPRVRFSADDLGWAQQTRQQVGGDPLVLCFPQTDYVGRDWPSCYWVDLTWRLKSQNVSVAVFLRDEDQRYMNVPLYFVGCSLRKVAALMSVAAVVVGSDSGPVHLAATIGAPTIALLGPSRAKCVFGHIPEVIALASDEPPGCAGCHYGHPYRAACDIACQSLYSLWPHVVLERVSSLLRGASRV